MEEYASLIRGYILQVKHLAHLVLSERMNKDMMIALGIIITVMSILMILTIILNPKKKFLPKLIRKICKISTVIIFFASPYIIHLYMNKVRPVETKVKITQTLKYLNSILIRGTIENKSPTKEYKGCVITAKVKRTSKNKYKNYIYQLITLRTQTKTIKKLGIAEQKEFRITIDHFNYKGKTNTVLKTDCY